MCELTCWKEVLNFLSENIAVVLDIPHLVEYPVDGVRLLSAGRW